MRVEIVFFHIYDVGRGINLSEAAKLLPASLDIRILKSKDTPESVSIPKPLLVEIDRIIPKSDPTIESIIFTAKVYEDGDISVTARIMIHNIDVDKVYTIKNSPITRNSQTHSIHEWLHIIFLDLYDRLKSTITAGLYMTPESMRETYISYCFIDQDLNPEKFVHENREQLAGLLIEEDPTVSLHETQIEQTLAHPFSFLKNDMVIFDSDRCIIIDPNRDYEDILLMIELANYQLLELRVLDRVLDYYLDKAEDEFTKKKKALSFIRTLADLDTIRLDSLFILENLENASKLIGDYFLGAIYNHLLKLFGADGYGQSVRTHMELLQSLYQTTKEDHNEKTLLLIEWLVLVVFIVDIAFSAISLIMGI